LRSIAVRSLEIIAADRVARYRRTVRGKHHGADFPRGV
jgi:hypothetical protein